MTLEEKLKKYVEYSINSHNSEYNLSNNDYNMINELKSDSIGNPDLSTLLDNIDKVESLEEKQKLVKEFMQKEEEKKLVEEKELISKIYGIDITNIEHKYLQNGKEVFSFYDDKINRKRILENGNDEESLTEQLKKMQNENENYQTNNYEENASNMLNDMSYNNNSELNMIYINDIYDEGNKNVIAKLSKEELSNLKSLLNKAEALNLSYINIDNQVALDKDGNIYESFYSEKEGKSIVENPESYKYNEDVMDNEHAVYNNMPEEEINSSKTEEERKEETEELTDEVKEEYLNEYEDLKELIDAEYKTYYINGNINTKAVFNRIVKYYNHPEELEYLVGVEKEFYEKMTEIFAEKIDEKKRLEEEAKKSLTLSDNKGISIPIVLSLIVILFLIVFIILK